MNGRHSLRVVAIALCSAATTAVSALDPQQFVAGWPIEAPAGVEVFDVPLTADVYAAAVGLEQLAVLDANGTPLPFFRRGAPAAGVAEERVTLEASPLYVDGPAGAAAVNVTTTDGGTSVAVTPGTARAAPVTGFVIDARGVAVAPLALELDWRALPQPFLLDVTIEQSTDLTDWRRVGSGAVAALAIGTAPVRHARVPVRANAGGYYRITAARVVQDWHLVRATLVSGTTELVVPLTASVAPLAPAAVPDAVAGALYFDAGGALPVASVTLEFAAANGWLRADVAASASLDGPWLPVIYSELFYSLAFEGREFANPAVAVGRREARYWRVQPLEPARDRPLTLKLEFPQEFLRVAASGAAPYLLAAGTLSDAAGPDATFAAVWSELRPAAGSVPLAVLGVRRELGGAAALVAPRPFPWRTLTLWAVLIGGALVVGLMAVRLAREMQSKPT